MLFLKDPESKGFDRSSFPQICEGKYVAVGSYKSVCAVEGPFGRGDCRLAIIVDSQFRFFTY